MGRTSQEIAGGLLSIFLSSESGRDLPNAMHPSVYGHIGGLAAGMRGTTGCRNGRRGRETDEKVQERIKRCRKG